VFPWVVSRCFFRKIGAVFNVESLPGVFKVRFEGLGGLFGLGLLQREGSAGLECRWVLWPGVARGH
jgi:hypothetical protein